MTNFTSVTKEEFDYFIYNYPVELIAHKVDVSYPPCTVYIDNSIQDGVVKAKIVFDNLPEFYIKQSCL